MLAEPIEHETSLLSESVGATTTKKVLKMDEILFYAPQIILAIQWLHETARVAHRDIKPQNVILGLNGKIYLTDFGSAARLMEDTASPLSGPLYLPRSACLTPHGTADYIAPDVLECWEDLVVQNVNLQSPTEETLLNELENDTIFKTTKGYDASVDWWSFGATMYEMAYGLPPFYAERVEDTYQRIMHCQVSLRSTTMTCQPRAHLGVDNGSNT